jgi:hypothetical protein
MENGQVDLDTFVILEHGYNAWKQRPNSDNVEKWHVRKKMAMGCLT